jgi:hypothetical protein
MRTLIIHTGIDEPNGQNYIPLTRFYINWRIKFSKNGMDFQEDYDTVI